MIPKTIHYCWFGRGEKPELARKCIASWQKFLPDYKIKEWNEDNFDLDIYPYARQAYDAHKFAFVTDVVRLYALYHEGGIYMDTDVEAIGTFDRFLHHHAFSGFETNRTVPTGMMAAEKGSQWAKELLDEYNDKTFCRSDGSFNDETNTVAITRYMVNKGLLCNNTFQDFPGLCTMYPSEYFCPKDHTTGKINLTHNTVCIHHFAGSWLDLPRSVRIRHDFKLKLVTIFGEKPIRMISDIITLRIFRQ